MVPVVVTPDQLMGDVGDQPANILRSPRRASLSTPPSWAIRRRKATHWLSCKRGRTAGSAIPTMRGRRATIRPAATLWWKPSGPSAVRKTWGRGCLLFCCARAAPTQHHRSDALRPAEGESGSPPRPMSCSWCFGGFDTAQSSTDHMSGFPYIMFADTGYQHIMIPVAGVREMDMATTDDAEMERMKAEAIEMELLSLRVDDRAGLGWLCGCHPSRFLPDGERRCVYLSERPLGRADGPEVDCPPPIWADAGSGDRPQRLYRHLSAFPSTAPVTASSSEIPAPVASLWVKGGPANGEYSFLVDRLRTTPSVESDGFTDCQRRAGGPVSHRPGRRGSRLGRDWARQMILPRGHWGTAATYVTDSPSRPATIPTATIPPGRI